MRVLVIDPCRDGGAGALDFAWRATVAGHKVKFFQAETPHNEFVGRGLVERVDDFNKWILWADLVLNVDNTKYIDIMMRARLDGQSVISATRESASWEVEREKGMAVLKKAGIPTAKSRVFSNYDEAIAFVKQTMGRYVSKPVGDGDADRSLSYCSKTPEDMVFMLERWKRNKRLGKFMLQEFKTGTEMAVGAFVGPGGFMSSWCENFEFKKLMNEDVGITTGEMGCVISMTDKSKLADVTLKKIEKEVIESGHIGYMDINCIIDDDGDVWPLEFTNRMGWPTFCIQSSMFDDDPVEWLKSLADGHTPSNFRDEVAVGAVIAIPDFPYSTYTAKDTVGIPIYNLTPEIQEHFHICSVMKGDAPMNVNDAIVSQSCMLTAGDYVGVMVGMGSSITAARKELYARIDAISIPNSPMYRTDIGVRLRDQLPKIQKHGFAKGVKF